MSRSDYEATDLWKEKDAHVFAGDCFAANVSGDELKAWAEEYLR